MCEDCVRRLAQRESRGRVMDVLRAAPTRAGGDSAGALMAGDVYRCVVECVVSSVCPPLGLDCCSWSPSSRVVAGHRSES